MEEDPPLYREWSGPKTPPPPKTTIKDSYQPIAKSISKPVHHVWLRSDREQYVDNRPGTFFNRFDTLDVENYEVGVAEISFPKTWLNITKPQVVGFLIQDGDKSTSYVHAYARVQPGCYTDYEDLINTINNQLLLYKDFLRSKKIHQILLMQNKGSGTTYLECGTGIILKPVFGDQLCEILGFEKNLIDPLFKVNDKMQWRLDNMGMKWDSNWVWGGDISTVPIKGIPMVEKKYHQLKGTSSLYLYSDIVEESILFGKKKSLLRKITIPDGSEYGQLVNIVYDKIHYYPLKAKELSSISLAIEDEKGRPVPFQSGETFVHLILRERQ
jgi:hypothetical protein